MGRFIHVLDVSELVGICTHCQVRAVVLCHSSLGCLAVKSYYLVATMKAAVFLIVLLGLRAMSAIGLNGIRNFPKAKDSNIEPPGAIGILFHKSWGKRLNIGKMVLRYMYSPRGYNPQKQPDVPGYSIETKHPRSNSR